MVKVRGKPQFTFRQYKYKELNVISQTTMKIWRRNQEHMDRLEKEKGYGRNFLQQRPMNRKHPSPPLKAMRNCWIRDLKDEATKRTYCPDTEGNGHDQPYQRYPHDIPPGGQRRRLPIPWCASRLCLRKFLNRAHCRGISGDTGCLRM